MSSDDVEVGETKEFRRLHITGVEPQKIDISANAVNATKGSLGSQYLVQTIGSTLSKYRASLGAPQLTGLTVVQNRYNPTLNYRHLMIPALMIMLVILICGFLSVEHETLLFLIQRIHRILPCRLP